MTVLDARSDTTLLDGKIPDGPLADKWDSYKFNAKLVNPNNKRKFKIIVVGTGLAGASAAATLAELGYQVDAFTFHDSPRRAHSIAAQGGINAAKNYKGDGDSVFRLFYDTVKGGDFRSRESNVYRLAEESVNIIDQCVAQGVPFAREYGGLLDNRSFGGALVSRTFYARGQTGQQLLLGAYQALMRQVGLGTVKLYPRHEMLELIVIDGRARGIVTRNRWHEDPTIRAVIKHQGALPALSGESDLTAAQLSALGVFLLDDQGRVVRRTTLSTPPPSGTPVSWPCRSMLASTVTRSPTSSNTASRWSW